ncbi:MAG: universal stress protein [Pseudomonadota bacterium]
MDEKRPILAVVDDGAEDLSAIERATWLADGYNAPIEIFSAIFDPYIAGERLFDSEDLIAAKTKRLADQRTLLEEIAVPLRSDGYQVEVSVVWDEPVFESVVRQALRSNPICVVRNNHFHNALQRGLFSNDDWNLIRTCPAPLWITRRGKSRSETLRIAAAVDPMHTHDKPALLDQTILMHAQSLADQTEGEMHVVHCYDATPVIAAMAAGTMSPYAVDRQSVTEQVLAEHKDALEAITADLARDTTEVHLVAGNPRDVLPAFVVDNAVDVLVVGAVSRGFIKRTFIGNTAEKVLDRTPCDLLIVKPKDFATPVKADSRHRFAPVP